MRRFLWIVMLSLSAATLPAAAGAGRLDERFPEGGVVIAGRDRSAHAVLKSCKDKPAAGIGEFGAVEGADAVIHAVQVGQGQAEADRFRCRGMGAYL